MTRKVELLLAWEDGTWSLRTVERPVDMSDVDVLRWANGLPRPPELRDPGLVLMTIYNSDIDQSSQCEGCDGSGVRVPAEPSCKIDFPNDGFSWVVAERCDTCMRFEDDLTAALSKYAVAKYVRCRNHGEHAIATLPKERIHTALDVNKLVLCWTCSKCHESTAIGAMTLSDSGYVPLCGQCGEDMALAGAEYSDKLENP